MALNIKSDEAHRLAKELAELTGRNLTEAVTAALQESLATANLPADPSVLIEEVAAIQRFVADLPDRDVRCDDEILGYDRFGLPGSA